MIARDPAGSLDHGALARAAKEFASAVRNEKFLDARLHVIKSKPPRLSPSYPYTESAVGEAPD